MFSLVHYGHYLLICVLICSLLNTADIDRFEEGTRRNMSYTHDLARNLEPGSFKFLGSLATVNPGNYICQLEYPPVFIQTKIPLLS